MSFKNIAAIMMASLLGCSAAFAEQTVIASGAESSQSSSRNLSEATKLRLAQKLQAKQQQAVPQTDKADQTAVPTKPQTNKALQPATPAKPQPAKVVQPTAPAKPKSYVSVRKVNLDGSPYVEEQPQPLKKQKKKQKQTVKPHEERTFFLDTMLPRDYQSIGIFGEAEATKTQAAAYLRNNNPSVKLACSVEKLVDLYWEEAQREGIRPDLALCQAFVETGFFKYGGDVHHNQNNFCGLGTTGGGVRGASFKTPQLGVRAHIQHLLAYSRTDKPKTAIVDPRYKVAHDLRLSRGIIDKWSGLNGTWAMGANYCEKIMYHYVRLLETKGAEEAKLSTGNTKHIPTNATKAKPTMSQRLEKIKKNRK